jgi:hypothetical protein
LGFVGLSVCVIPARFYDCNKYQKGKAEGKFAAEEERRRTAQEMLDK